MEYAYPVAFVYISEIIFGIWASSICQMGTTLIMDIHPSSPAAAGATVNLVRCLLGAGITAATLPLMHTIGKGWFHSFVGVAWVFCGVPLVWWVIRNGVRLRRERAMKACL